MAKKRRASHDRESSEEPQFVVEVIKAARVKGKGWEYRVKWANYDSEDDTWEPEKNLKDNCKRLLDSFWKDIGMDDEDYPEGYTVKATPSWIKKEKRFFARSLAAGGASSSGEESDERQQQASTSQVKQEYPSSKGKGKEVPKSSTGRKRGRPPKAASALKPKEEPRMERAEDSDDAPLSSLALKGKKRAQPPSPASDDEDEPLAKHRKSRPAPPEPGKATASFSASAVKGPSTGQDERQHDSGSESAGSLFSEKASSPEVALGTVTSSTADQVPKGTTIPMKRPSVDDGGSNRHRKRQVMEMPMVITGTAGNSTKARLAQRGHQPPVPPTTATGTASAPDPPLPPGTRPATQKLDLNAFSFKKKSAAAAQSPIQTQSPTAPALPRRSTSISDNVQSPMSVDLPTPTAESNPPLARMSGEARRPTLPIPRRTSMQSAPQNTLADADKFLSNIMPPDIAAPMREESTPDTPTTPNISAPARKPPPLPRIGKKWRWSGEMFIDVSREKAERVCEITLHDPTDPLPNGLRFSICMKGDSIRLSAFHDIASLPIFLEACARVQQFAKVTPSEDKDADAVKQIAVYMMKRSFFCYAHLYVEETSAALLILFPAGHPIAAHYLKVPPGQAGDALLQAALVPWELKAKDFQRLHWKPRTSTLGTTLDPAFIPMLEMDGRKVVTQRRFHQALHVLGFPKALYDFLVVPNHPYCIWYAPGDMTSAGRGHESLGYETLMLKEILSTCASQDVRYKADARVVFIHVGALSKLHCLPALAERRSKHPDLRFVTYGTHPSVPRERWGIRELFPIGGIVTFTPTAIIQGHYRIFERISQIAEHPLWECYVLPAVVAMVAKLSCQGLNPLQVYDEGNFIYEDLLRAIEDGSLALLQAPQVTRDPPAQGEPTVLWTRWMFRLGGLNARGILEECLKLAAEQFANTAEADLPLALEKEIVRDLVRLQMQPAIMDNYRRFVVFRTKQDAFLAESSKYGIECTTHDKFDFKDDYFESSNVSEKK
ncbi:hypothetical protein BV20DRAFT_1041377 [Pilatotrama ljubarskyi]|nr:hypothetical protein BV20DRAFT_1041377 [Pilatotrama ljubarskyi]